MDKRKYRELTGLNTIKIRVCDDVLKALVDQDRDNPAGPKAGFAARLVIQSAFDQGLIPGLVASARNKMHGRN